MSQRLFRSLQGSGNSICSLRDHGLYSLPLACRGPQKLPYSHQSSESFSTKRPPKQWTRTTAQGRFKTSAVEDGTAQQTAELVHEPRKTPAVSQHQEGHSIYDFEYTADDLVHQVLLESRADQLARLLRSPSPNMRSDRIQGRTHNLLQTHSFGSDNEESLWKPGGGALLQGESALQGSGEQLNATASLLRHQIMASKGAKDLERVVKVAFSEPASNEQKYSKSQKTAFHLNQPEVQRLLVSRFAQRRQPGYENTLLATLINKIFRKGQLVQPSLLYKALHVAAAGHNVEGMIRYLQILGIAPDIVGGAAREKVLLDVGGYGRQRLRQDWLLSFLQLLRSGLVTGNVFTGARKPTAISDILHIIRSHRTAFDESFFDNWRVLHAWVYLLTDCGAGDHIWAIWEVVKARSFGVPWTDPTIRQNHCKQLVQFFMHMLFQAGSPRHAWQIYKECGLLISSPANQGSSDADATHGGIHTSTWRALIAHSDAKPDLDPVLQNAFELSLVNFYGASLKRTEKSMGVKWESSGVHQVDQVRTKSILDRDTDSSDHRASPEFRQLLPHWPACSMPAEVLAAFFGNANAEQLGPASWDGLEETFGVMRSMSIRHFPTRQ